MPTRLVLWVNALHSRVAGFNYCSQFVVSGATCAQGEPVWLYVEDWSFCPHRGACLVHGTVLSRAEGNAVSFPVIKKTVERHEFSKKRMKREAPLCWCWMWLLGRSLCHYLRLIFSNSFTNPTGWFFTELRILVKMSDLSESCNLFIWYLWRHSLMFPKQCLQALLSLPNDTWDRILILDVLNHLSEIARRPCHLDFQTELLR